MQKKITHQFFIKLEKPYLEPNLEPLGQTPKQFFFLRNSTPPLFNLDDNLISCKKSENFNNQFRRKTLGKRTNRQMKEQSTELKL